MRTILPLLLLPVLAHAQPGTVDLSFGTDGIVRTDPGGGNATCASVLVRSNGFIYAAGSYTNANNNTDFVVAKYLANGSPDPSFGTNGIATTPVGLSNDNCYTATLQPDGKVLLGGDFANSAGGYSFAVVRFLDNGTLDPTFGNGGIATVDMGSTDNYGTGMGVRSDGKILLAGRHTGDDVDYIVLCLNANGTLDTGFGDNGMRIQPVGVGTDNCYTMVVTADDGAVLVGDVEVSGSWDAALVKVTSAGDLDNTFGTGGIAVADLGGSSDFVYAAALQSDGKIVIAGAGAHPTLDQLIARFTANGTLDASFGASGVTYTDFGGVENGSALAIAGDGSYFVSGHSPALGFTLTHYFANGTLDTGFGTGGQVATLVPNGFNITSGVAVDGAQRVLVCGHARDPIAVDTRFVLVRYHYGDLVGIGERVGTASSMHLGPDPVDASSVLRFGAEHAGRASAHVVDGTGRVMLRLWTGRAVTSGAHAEPVPALAQLPAGRYLLVLTIGEERSVVPFVRSND